MPGQNDPISYGAAFLSFFRKESGSIIRQVHFDSKAGGTPTTNNTTSYVTHFKTAFTPKSASSTIIIIGYVKAEMATSTAGTRLGFRLTRDPDGTPVTLTPDVDGIGSNDSALGAGHEALVPLIASESSPGTSEVEYGVRFKRALGNANSSADDVALLILEIGK